MSSQSRYGAIDEPVNFQDAPTTSNPTVQSMRRRFSQITVEQLRDYFLHACALFCSGLFLLSGSLSIVFYSHRIWSEFIEPHSFIGPFLPDDLCKQLLSGESWIHLITAICFIIHVVFFKIDTKFSLSFQVILIYLGVNVLFSGAMQFLALALFRCGVSGLTCARVATWLPEFLCKASIWVFMIFGTVVICVSVGTFILWLCSDEKVEDEEEGSNQQPILV